MNLLLELLEINEALLLERHPPHGSWSILPATMELYNRRTVDIITAASNWDEETILVCTKERGNGTERFVFIGSGGNSYDSYEKIIGTTHDTHHDQTGASKGRYKVINVVYIKDGKIIKKANDLGTDVKKDKASLSVFK